MEPFLSTGMRGRGFNWSSFQPNLKIEMTHRTRRYYGVRILSGYRLPMLLWLRSYVYVEDVDTTYKRAIQAGATSVREPANQAG